MCCLLWGKINCYYGCIFTHQWEPPTESTSVLSLTAKNMRCLERSSNGSRKMPTSSSGISAENKKGRVGMLCMWCCGARVMAIDPLLFRIAQESLAPILIIKKHCFTVRLFLVQTWTHPQFHETEYIRLCTCLIVVYYWKMTITIV